MSFDLMQEEIIAKCTWLGTKLGVIDPESENPVEEECDNYTEINNVKKYIPNSFDGSDSGRVSYNSDGYSTSRVSSTEPLQKTEIISKPRTAHLQNLPPRTHSKI